MPQDDFSDVTPMPNERELEARFAKLKESISESHASDDALDEVEAKLHEMLEKTEIGRAEADIAAEQHHAEFDAKLSELSGRLENVREKSVKVKDSSSVSGSLDRGTAVGMGYGLTLAYTIVGTPIAGYGIGLLINKLTKTEGWTIWLTLLGGIIGISWVVMVTSRNADRF